ncbi:MAG: hypothetical protein QOJ58_5008, partial [Alphaproteobacteria bacterium]|nr:hypothetical protein [Alphaproteobacteria bacterium]
MVRNGLEAGRGESNSGQTVCVLAHSTASGDRKPSLSPPG